MKKLAIALGILTGFLAFAGFAFAQYSPLAPLPIGPGGTTPATWTLSTYLTGAIKLLVASAGALAVVMLVIGGTQYVAAGINPSAKGDAKERIGNALIGLILVLTSYLILNSIDPKLVQFNLSLSPVAAVPMKAYTAPTPVKKVWGGSIVSGGTVNTTPVPVGGTVLAAAGSSLYVSADTPVTISSPAVITHLDGTTTNIPLTGSSTTVTVLSGETLSFPSGSSTVTLPSGGNVAVVIGSIGSKGSKGGTCVNSGDPGSGLWVPPNTTNRVVADPGGSGILGAYIPGCLNGQFAKDSSSGCAANESYSGVHLGSGKQLLLRYTTPANINDGRGIKVSAWNGGNVASNMRIWLSGDPTATYASVPELCKASTDSGGNPSITTGTETSVDKTVNEFGKLVTRTHYYCKVEPNKTYYFGMEIDEVVSGHEARFQVDAGGGNFKWGGGGSSACGTSWYTGDPGKGSGSWYPPGMSGVIVVDTGSSPTSMHIPACANGASSAPQRPCYSGFESFANGFTFGGTKVMSIRMRGVSAPKLSALQMKSGDGGNMNSGGGAVRMSISSVPGNFSVSSNCVYTFTGTAGTNYSPMLFYANGQAEVDAYFAAQRSTTPQNFTFCPITPGGYYYVNIMVPNAQPNQQYYLEYGPPLE